MSEHIKALFTGQDLSEEFKEKASTIFTAALAEQAKTIRDEVTAELQETFETRTQARLEELNALSESYLEEQVKPNVDKYLTAAIAEWTTENKQALVATAKVDLAESFITGLVGLAESHNLNLPAGTVDQIAKLEESIASMNTNLTKLTDEKIELQAENRKFKAEKIVIGITATLSENQKATFAPVIESIEYKSDDQYATAIKGMYESYFPVDAVKTAEELQRIAEQEEAARKLQESTNRQVDSYESSLMKALLEG